MKPFRTKEPSVIRADIHRTLDSILNGIQAEPHRHTSESVYADAIYVVVLINKFRSAATERKS